MDRHLLRTFVAVADSRSFSAAARRLGYTQSAVSQHIAALEGDLGTPVQAGAGRDGPGRGTPGGRDRFRNGEYAVALVDGVVAPSDPLRLLNIGDLGGVAIAEQPLVVLVPDGHPLANRSGLSLTDLLDARWIDAPDVAAPLSDLAAVARSDSPRASLRYEGIDTAVLVALVVAGHGLAVLPVSVATGRAGVCQVALTAPRLVHRTELLHPRDPGSVVEALIAALTGQRG